MHQCPQALHQAEALCAQIITPIGALRIYSAVIGRHNVPNMLAAVATALATSIPGTQITLAVRALAFILL